MGWRIAENGLMGCSSHCMCRGGTWRCFIPAPASPSGVVHDRQRALLNNKAVGR